MTSLDQLLTNAVYHFRQADIDECMRCIVRYYSARHRGEEEPVTIKNKVRGDKIAESLLTLINSRMYPYLVDEVNTKCPTCGE